MTSEPRLVEVRRNVMKKNDLLAAGLRDSFRRAGVYVVSLVSSPGSGKTTLLEKTLSQLGRTHRVAALVGDLATDNDAARLARSGAPVRQIVTGTVCHLDAEMVRGALDGWPGEELDFLFIENVGNLVCPALFDLGERKKVVIASVTEGEDKPLKYPHMFRACDVLLLNKIDLLPHVSFDTERFAANARRVNARVRILPLSATRGDGLPEWLGFLRGELTNEPPRVEV
jgi:hydrogenase nickel incorporation protein HypB